MGKCADDLFHVYVWRNPPAGSSGRMWREKATTCPVDHARAQEWCDSIDHMIANGNRWFANCEIEPAECPRPWTHEIKSAFDREQMRCSIEAEPCYQALASLRDSVLTELSQIIGSKRANEVISGAGGAATT